MGQTDMVVDTLDHQLIEHGLSNIDFIQLDTQGSELYITGCR